MTTPSQALAELHDHATRFLRDESQRLLHVITSAPLRGAVLDLLMGLELSPHAQGPFVCLEHPHADDDPGWEARAASLRHHHQQRRHNAGVRQDRWPSLGHAPLPPGLAGFARVLGALPAGTPDARPWLIVLAPTHVHAPAHPLAVQLERVGGRALRA